LPACGIAVLALAAAVWLGQTPPLPGPQVASFSRPDSHACAECHEQRHADFQSAPHARTLRRLDDPDLLKQFADRQYHDAGSGADLSWSVTEGRLFAHVAQPPRSIRLDWAFGSGRHAITPASVKQNPEGAIELLEHRVSWYPSGGVQATLGLAGTTTSHRDNLGDWHTPAAAARCFGCHSTRVPQVDGRINIEQLLPNVQCDRCHQGSQEHVRAMRAGQAASGLLHWPALSSLEAVNRCGECHRRADEFRPEELQPESTRLVRFASVGLVQSPCFQHGAHEPARHPDSLTCVRCHDPHQPARDDTDYYRQRCLECHGAERTRKPCSVQPATSQCTQCHMPKVSLNPWLSFTDHWIRVRAKE
jgi:hypothetical protein